MPIWTGTTNSNWSTGSNWDTGIVPTTTTDAIFSSSFNVACVVDGTSATIRDCANLTIGSGYTANITLSGSIRSGVSTVGGININGTPTFSLGTPSGSLILWGSTLNRSISSSANVIIPRLSTQVVNATLSTSGSIVCNNIQFDQGGSVLTFAGVGFTASNGTVSGTGTGTAVSGTPGLYLTGSISWNYSTALPLNITIAPGCNFNQTSSLNVSSRALNVDSTATLNCSSSTALIFNGNCSLNMNGSTTNRFNALSLSIANLTLLSDVYLQQYTASLSATTVIGNFTWGGSNTLIGNYRVFVGGNLGLQNNQPVTSTRYSAGGSKIVMYGAGYIGPTAGILGTQGVDVDISSSYPIQLGAPGVSVTWNATTSTLRYITASSFIASNSSSISAGTTTPGTIIDFQGQTINNLANAGGIIFLSSSLICSGSYSISIGTSILSGSTLEVQRNLTGPSNGNSAGTATIILGGNTPTTYSILLTNNININKTAGGSVLLGNTYGLTYSGGTFNYTAGSVNPGTSTMTLGTSTVNGMSWYNLTVPGIATITSSVSNSISNNLTLATAGNVTFTGSAGWTCANLICSTTGRTITLANSSSGASYKTTTNASLTATSASRITMTSDNATTQSIWTLDNGAIQSLIYVNGTRIDSSQGQTIWSFGGTLVNTSNWGTGSRPLTQANTFVC